MTGHVNRLNLIADAPGISGRTAEINGADFACMKSVARTVPKQVFDV